MDVNYADLEQRVPVSGLLGYLNFSDGKPDPRWQKSVHDAFGFFLDARAERPWQALHQWMTRALGGLQSAGSPAFRDVTQARATLDLFARVLPAYRAHHSDLLAHQGEAELFQPFFLARVFETILSTGAHRLEGERAVEPVLTGLNDFVGYRPIALLETRPRGEPYEHERHRPLPIYLRGVGPARGKYHDVLVKALDILSATDKDLLQAAHFGLDQLDEIAVDLRAYDHGHPVNRRPNYVFGEWDPHQIDNSGRYRRYVARQVTLDGLLARVQQPGERDPGEVLFEAAAVLAGTILMATGISGRGPTAHDSSATLAALMPRIARYRDEFYQHLLKGMGGRHAERIRQEQELTRQPFGAARQHLNAFLARHRAAQMQQRFLSLLFAEMGYPEASRTEARKIPTASIRFLSEVLGRLSTGHHEVEHGRLREAAGLLPEVEDLIRRGIGCGAVADPWNILGFQGLFPLSAAQEDSLRDPRLDELVQLMEQTFHLYARLSSEAAAAGDAELVGQLAAGMKKLAEWWDPFATTAVGDVRKVQGSEAAASAEHVATALSRWHERGEATADLAFWRQHLDSFRSPKAFALVVDALLRKKDHKAALALLINWVGQAEEVPLEEGPHSFHQLALRWLLAVTGAAAPVGRDLSLVQKFFDYLEANAEEFWRVPALDLGGPAAEKEEKEDLYSAAYDDVTYRDTTGGDEGEVVGGEGPEEEYDLEEEAERLERRLRFLSTVARLWVVAGRAVAAEPQTLTTAAWLETARNNLDALLQLVDAIHNLPLPLPPGSYDSLVEYDRRRVAKEQLVYTTIATCLDMTMAVGALQGAQGDAAPVAGSPHLAEWGADAIRLERALFRGDVSAARGALAGFLEHFRQEPLLFTPLADGGDPRQILRVRVAQAILRVLLINLPRLGLLRETYDLLRTARAMEQNQPPRGRGVTEFSQYFQAGFVEAVEAVVASSAEWNSGFEEGRLANLLERLTAPFLTLWVEHSRTVQISSLETIGEEGEWSRLQAFVRRYGSDLFHARFMTLANLRGVLHRGIPAYLEHLGENADPLKPIKLIDELDEGLPRAEAVRRLEFILRAVVENYEEYKDYNATTSQSDYGENLFVLLDFLRLKASYDRHAWEFRPLMLAHEVLARRGRRGAAILWEKSLTQLTGALAKQYLDRLGQVERVRGVRLNTVADRLNERFVKPLALDRLRALIEPAIKEAKAGGPTTSFARLQEELHAYTATPTGVGLDVPAWLRSLEAEVHRVQASGSTLAQLAESFYRIPRRSLSLDEVKRQLDHWEHEALPH